jgi:hypothetical protein
MNDSRLQALAQLAATIRDAELAALAARSAELRATEERRQEIAVQLGREAAFALSAPEVPHLCALDAHALFAARFLDALSSEVSRLAGLHAAARADAARAFGRAEVLETLAKRAHRSRRAFG